MSENNKLIEDIIAACLNDTRLISIIKNVSKLNEEQKMKFRKNASFVLKGKKTTDKEALKFYYAITEDNVAEIVVRRLEDGKET